MFFFRITKKYARNKNYNVEHIQLRKMPRVGTKILLHIKYSQRKATTTTQKQNYATTYATKYTAHVVNSTNIHTHTPHSHTHHRWSKTKKKQPNDTE